MQIISAIAVLILGLVARFDVYDPVQPQEVQLPVVEAVVKERHEFLRALKWPIYVSPGETTIRAEDISAPAQPRQLEESYIRSLLIMAGAEPRLIDSYVAIAWCESRWQPNQWNQAPTEAPEGSKGLYQLDWTTWFAEALRQGTVEESEREMWADPFVNTKVAVAARTYLGRFGGDGGWGCAQKVGLR